MRNIDYLANASAIRDQALQEVTERALREAKAPLEIPLEAIDPNPFQPRQDFEHVESLVQSIQQNGQYYPILVRKTGGDRYEVADGESRLKAFRILHEAREDFGTIKAVVVDYTNIQMALIALDSAYQRKDLSPIEEARGIKRIHDELTMSYEELADKLGKKKHHFINRVRLLNFPGPIQSMVEKGELSASQAVNIMTGLKPEDDGLALELAERVVREGMSVTDIRAYKQEKLEPLKEKKAFKAWSSGFKKQLDRLEAQRRTELLERINQLVIQYTT